MRLRQRAVARVIEPLEQRVLFSATLLGDAFYYPLGNFDNAGLTLNGGAAISQANYADQLQLTDGGANESRSAFTTQEYAVSPFSTNFNVQFSGPSTSGFAFVLQGAGSTALGAGSAGSDGIAKSVAVEFLSTPTGTETELNVNGVATTPTPISPSTINLSNNHVLLVSIEYDGSTLRVTESDNQSSLTPITSTQTYTNVNIAAVTGSTAFVGFTGADSSTGVTQLLQSWEFANVLPTDADIGSPSAAGSSAYTAGGQYTVHGAGTGAGSTSDQFHLTSEAITGNATMLGELNVPASGSKTVEGLMLREGAAANAAFGEVDLTASGVQFISRTSAGAADTTSATISASGTEWLELVRDGPIVSGYISTSSGGPWTLVGTSAVNGSTNALMGLAVSSGSSSTLATATFTGVSVTETSSIGLDTGVVVPETEPIWVDIVKQSGGFYNTAETALASTNANGWPTTDFTIPNLISATPDEDGTYSLVMKVNHSPTVTFSGATLSNASYNSTTDTYTASVTISGVGNVSMEVTGTNGGITSLQIISPGYSTTNPPVFTTSYINYLQSLHPTVLRFMDWAQTNSNPVQTWAERSTPADATQYNLATMYNYNGSVYGNGFFTGVCWEYAIELANAVHADIWINIPEQANDAYVEQLASLIQNGDTINGVTYPALNPDLSVYVEYSNETWNSGFTVYQYSLDAAVAEVTTDAQNGTQSNLNYDNLSLAESNGVYVNGNTWQQRWCARRLLQISNDFASVMGESAINTRIRPVLSNIPIPSVQAGQLAFINAEYGPPDQYFYAVATATYANLNGPYNGANTLNGGSNNPNLTPAQVLQDLSANGYFLPYALYDELDAVAQQYNLQMDGYESGPDTSGYQDTATSKVTAENSPQFSTFLEQYYEGWFSTGGGTIIYYDAQAKPWGDEYGDFQIADTQEDLFDAKEVGFRAVVTAERPGLVPAVIASLTANTASSTQVNLSWGTTSAGATEYRVEASNTSGFTANVVTQIAPAGSNSWSFTGLSPGIQYYFQVIATSPAGDAGPSPSATATTSGTAPIPVAPTNVTATAVSNSQINVAWADSSLIETGYTITVATNPTFTQIVQTLSAAAGATSISVYGLNGLTDYYVEVSAQDSSGSSAAVAAPPTITPMPLPLAQYTFSSVTGGTVLDTSGNGTAANGTIVGGVTQVAGPDNGEALAFDGSTGYVNLGTPSKLNLEGQFTIGAWIKPTAVTSNSDIFDQGFDGLDEPIFFNLTTPTTVNFGTLRYNGSYDSVYATGTSSTSLTNGQWHYVAGVYDGQDFKVYIDGVLAGETADPYGVTYGWQPTNIGRDADGAENFDGDIADLQIFSSGLSAADIAKLSGPISDTWKGGTSTWATAGNWSAGVTPGGFTSVVINSGAVTAGAAFSVGSLVLNAGTLNLATGAGQFSVASLTLGSSATLNLENNFLMIDYAAGADPISTIAGYLKSGRNGGAWNGPGIDSSSVAAHTGYALGYADGKDGVAPGIPSGQIEVKFTLMGDANLDGIVNGTDFAILAAHFGQGVTAWDEGDFNYDSVVNGSDFAALAANFGQSASQAAVALPAVVPSITVSNLSTTGDDLNQTSRGSHRKR